MKKIVIKCPQCGAEVDTNVTTRCPRCNFYLIHAGDCSGCGKCLKRKKYDE